MNSWQGKIKVHIGPAGKRILEELFEMGTPKTLNEAIINGLAAGAPAGSPVAQAHLSKKIEAHVLDFLRQRFGSAYLVADSPYGRPDNGKALALLEELARSIGVT